MNIEKFGPYIAQKRKEQNMTQKDLAEKLNVTPKAVSRWERSIGYPDIETFEGLASALNVPILNLFDCSDTENEITADDLMKIVYDSVEIDRRNNRIQERRVGGIIAAVTLLTGFLFHMGGYGNIGASLFFGLLCAGIVASLYYLLSEDDSRNTKIYGSMVAVLVLVVFGILWIASR